jgi:hypothetical protein
MLEFIITGDDRGILRADDVCNTLHKLVEFIQACVWRQSQWSSFCFWPATIGGSVCSWCGANTNAIFACEFVLLHVWKLEDTRCFACFEEVGMTTMLYYFALWISGFGEGGDDQLPVATMRTQLFVFNSEGSTRDRLWPRSS